MVQHLILQERQRIARDMHDELGSPISAIQLLSSHIKAKCFKGHQDIISDIEKIHESSVELNQKIHEIIWSMNEKDDHLNSLLEYTKRWCSKLTLQTQIPIVFHDIKLNTNPVLSGEFRKNIYLSIKEAICNSIKHSKASEINIKFKLYGTHVIRIEIQDNGIGFHQESIDLYAKGNGLYNMNYRMKSIDGTCILFSNRRGCSVILEIELPNI